MAESYQTTVTIRGCTFGHILGPWRVAELIVLHQHCQDSIRNTNNVASFDPIEPRTETGKQNRDRYMCSRRVRSCNRLTSNSATHIIAERTLTGFVGHGDYAGVASRRTREAPGGPYTRSWRTLNNRAYIAGGVPPISPRNNAPRSSRANRPGLSLFASVYTPALYPSKSFSSKVSGKLPQLMATNHFSRRRES